MNKMDAIMELMHEARQPRGSTTAAKRVVRACRALDLDTRDTRGVLSRLEYCNAETGEPFGSTIERVWK